MRNLEIRIPAMGEGITEATIIKYLKNAGEYVQVDDVLVEIATDKVDSEIIAPKSGQIERFLFKEGEIAQVGETVLILKVEQVSDNSIKINEETKPEINEKIDYKTLSIDKPINEPSETEKILYKSKTDSNKFLSPLVRNIADKEGISYQELDLISGTGIGNRITKADVLNFAKEKSNTSSINLPLSNNNTKQLNDSTFEIIEMDRMRKLISAHMTESKRISAHVTSFIEVDLTGIVMWRNSIKEKFFNQYKEKITFTPIFVEAIVKAIKEFPMINVSVENTNIIVKKQINIGMATALPNGNLIVPVIKNAADLSLLGITKKVNDLADRARANKLKPEEIQGGTFTITNVGSFGNITGTPIINQPEVAIIAIGAIKKKPAVIETPLGDTIGIRHLMIMSMTYDHRVVDGALGGMFLKKVTDILESFDSEREI